VGALGALTGCIGTGSTFAGLDGISLANGYAYVANQTGGTVSVCPVNSNGSLLPCALSPIGTGVAPTSVAINGAQAYVNDLNGNIYLCSVGLGGALGSCAPSNGGTAFNFGIQIAIH
jgi:DNA-binding beta-propeller fold protein YncE